MTPAAHRSATIGPAVGRGPVVELLRAQFRSLELLGASLTRREWFAPASLPGWSVLDVYAHIVGNESMLEGNPLPHLDLDVARLDHVQGPLAVLNETWIEALSPLTPDALLDRFRQVSASRLRTLDLMTPDGLAALVLTPHGRLRYGRYLEIRVFDCWMHEQDIREGLDRPGHETGPCARAALAEAVRCLVPDLTARAGVPAGATVTIELTGPLRERLHLAVLDGGAAVVEEVEDATATISLSSGLFFRLIGGRRHRLSPRLGSIEFAGDLDLAGRIVTNLAVTP